MASNRMKLLFSSIGVKDQIYRILFNIIAIGTSVFIIKSYLLTNTEIDRFGSPVGAGLVALGLGLVINALINYDLLAFIGLKKEEKYDDLITSGLNRYIRHPLYLGILIALIGWASVYFSGAAVSTFVITFLYIQIGIYLEEKKLIEQFGDQYINYQGKVPKLFPRFWKG